jgi:hypothetical protein
MSHALRTPLNTIIGFAKLMLMRDVEQMAAEQPRLHRRHPEFRRARRSSTTSSTARLIEADHLPPSETVFDLPQFLDDGLRLVRAQDAGGRRRTAWITGTGRGIPPERLERCSRPSTRSTARSAARPTAPACRPAAHKHDGRGTIASLSLPGRAVAPRGLLAGSADSA